MLVLFICVVLNGALIFMFASWLTLMCCFKLILLFWLLLPTRLVVCLFTWVLAFCLFCWLFLDKWFVYSLLCVYIERRVLLCGLLFVWLIIVLRILFWFSICYLLFWFEYLLFCLSGDLFNAFWLTLFWVVSLFCFCLI